MGGAVGTPRLSSGMEWDLQYAREHATDVYVIWKPKKEHSPFVTQTANKCLPLHRRSIRVL